MGFIAKLFFFLVYIVSLYTKTIFKQDLPGLMTILQICQIYVKWAYSGRNVFDSWCNIARLNEILTFVSLSKRGLFYSHNIELKGQTGKTLLSVIFVRKQLLKYDKYEGFFLNKKEIVAWMMLKLKCIYLDDKQWIWTINIISYKLFTTNIQFHGGLIVLTFVNGFPSKIASILILQQQKNHK